jgi:hypothetical protein
MRLLQAREAPHLGTNDGSIRVLHHVRDECVEEAKQPGTPARRWLEEQRKTN